MPINLRKANKGTVMEVEVHITKEFRIRQYIAFKLIWLACRVLGCGLKFDVGEPPVYDHEGEDRIETAKYLERLRQNRGGKK